MKTSIYLPKDLAEQVKALGLPVSQIVRQALVEAIETRTQRCSRCGQRVEAAP